MEAGGVRLGLEPFVRAEVLHSSERTRITRLFLPGRTVIRKEPRGTDADRRARHEVAMLERLLGVAGVNYIMGVPGADDIMLQYQSTSFQDALYLRDILGLRPAPEFETWLAGDMPKRLSAPMQVQGIAAS